jgi:hypothetical protein
MMSLLRQRESEAEQTQAGQGLVPDAPPSLIGVNLEVVNPPSMVVPESPSDPVLPLSDHVVALLHGICARLDRLDRLEVARQRNTRVSRPKGAAKRKAATARAGSRKH